MTKTETHEFQAEVSRLLHLMVHSVYSEKEVFLRELISNASDACDKLRYEAITNPDLTSGDENFGIEIEIDKEARTLTIVDNGIGMSHDELIENLGTIARSGTNRFLEQVTSDDKEDVSLIGQFGVGFYSAFMISDHVEVYSRRAGEEATWQWTSDGTGSFSLSDEGEAPSLLSGRGTAIVLKLRDGEDEYLDANRLKNIVQTYSDHVALPITLKEKGSDEDPEQLNTARAIWTRQKSDISEEQYKEFYHHVGGMVDEPAHTLHYHAEGRHSYSVLLFFPSMQPFDLFDPDRANRLKLYVNRVFITDNAPLLPGYLRFLRGVVDSEDMPLNISREMLQNNPIVGAIRKALTNRVLSELSKKSEKDVESFVKIWDVFGSVLKEGLYEDFEHQDQLLKLARFKTTHSDEWRSLADYVADMKENQTAIYFIAGDDAGSIAKSPQLEGFKARGIEVLLLSDAVDGFWTNTAQGFEGKPFSSVTRGSADFDAIPVEGEKKPEAEEVDRSKVATLTAFIKQSLEDVVEDVRQSDRLTDSAVCLVASDTGLDMQMEKILAQHGRGDGASKRVLEINPDHPLICALAERAAQGTGGDDLEDAAYLLLDQARILEGDPVVDGVAFSRRMAKVMASAFGGAS